MLLTCSPYGDFPIQDSVFLFLLSWNSNPCPAQLNVQVCVPRRALSEGARIPHLAQWPSSAATDPRNLKMVAQLLWGRLSYLESRMKMIKPYLPTSQGYFEKQIKLWILKVLKWLGERGTFSVYIFLIRKFEWSTFHWYWSTLWDKWIQCIWGAAVESFGYYFWKHWKPGVKASISWALMGWQEDAGMHASSLCFYPVHLTHVETSYTWIYCEINSKGEHLTFL